MISFGEYVYTLIKENPDSIYGGSHRPFFTFMFVEDCIIYTDSEFHTHTDILEYYAAVYENPVMDKHLRKVIMDNFQDNDIYVMGQLPKSFTQWAKTTNNNYWVSFDTKFSHSMLGRASKNKSGAKNLPHDSIMSFWQTEKRIDQQNLNNIIRLCEELDIDENDCLFEFGERNEQVYQWDELIPSKEKPKDEPKIFPVVHTLDPALKGNIMKQQGIKPKQNPIDITDRYKINQESMVK